MTPWELIGTGPDWSAPAWEWWRAPNGDVYRRRPSLDSFERPDGTPSGVRWEGGAEWFARFYVVERSAAREVPRVRPR